MLTLETGTILISEPFLDDPNFERTVVLLTQYDKNEGAVGFILNKKTELLLSDLVANSNESYQIPIYFGGPVSTDTLFFIYQNDTALITDTVLIGNNLHWGGDFDQFIAMINAEQIKLDQIKLFLGYSGWDQHQLENEISQKAWYTYHFDEKVVIASNPNTMWRDVLQKKGGKYKMISNYPIDPKLN